MPPIIYKRPTPRPLKLSATPRRKPKKYPKPLEKQKTKTKKTHLPKGKKQTLKNKKKKISRYFQAFQISNDFGFVRVNQTIEEGLERLGEALKLFFVRIERSYREVGVPIGLSV